MMRLTVVANEFPYPPSHGGRVDVWRRLCAMREAGVQVQLVCWANEEAGSLPTAAALDRAREVVQTVHLFSFRRGAASRIRRVAQLRHLPWSVAGRALAAAEWRSLLAAQRAFEPDAIWLDALYGGEVARRLAHELQRPLFYRSHNIEHLYTGRQVALARAWPERWRWRVRSAHIEHYERAILDAADAFFDISVDDLAYWRTRGFRHGHWLPPLVDSAMAQSLSAPVEAPSYDIGYLGNLFMPNNVDGVVWLLEQVMPLVVARLPQVTLCIAGSRIAPRVRAALAACPAARFIDSPPDAGAVLRDARVLVNPVFAGSGVNIKAVEMLFAPGALVSTAQGVAGLPPEVRACFRVADDAPSFSQSILSALAAQHAQCPQADALRQQARRHFRSERLRELLPLLRRDPGVTAPALQLA